MFGFGSKKILYFPGCFTSLVLPEIVANYNKIFNKLKLEVHFLPKEVCCGAVAHSNGYTTDFEELKQRALGVFSNSNIKNIITNSADCLSVLTWKYGFKVWHVTQLLAQYTKKFPVMHDEEVNYYDPIALRIYSEPRAILNSLGFLMIIVV